MDHKLHSGCIPKTCMETLFGKFKASSMFIYKTLCTIDKYIKIDSKIIVIILLIDDSDKRRLT